METYFNKISPKLKLKLLIVLMFAVLIPIYMVTLSGTLHQYQTYKKNQQELKLLSAKILNNQDANPVASTKTTYQKYSRTELFEQINVLASDYQLQIVKFHPEEVKSLSSVEVITTQIEIQGSYVNMIIFFNEIENLKKISQIKNISFGLKPDLKSKKNQLYANFFLQNYTTKNS